MEDEDPAGPDLTLTRAEVLEHALDIVRDYEEQDLTLTLRQMYYQFVSRGLLPNGQKVYKRIGDVLTDARYDGSFPIDGLLDRGRDVHVGDFLRGDGYTEGSPEDQLSGARVRADNAEAIIKNLPNVLVKRARWFGQPTFVSVWVEKQALEGVIQPVADELGVSWFACKGYPSVSALWDWIKAADASINGPPQNVRYSLGGGVYTEERAPSAERAVILYFGDHDPDGWEIPRSAERNLNRLMNVRGINVDVEFRRIALNRDQIDQYNPPPFEAKMTSARYKGYVDEHDTTDAWELDALEPRVLRDLIRENVNAEFDLGISATRLVMENQTKGALRAELRRRGIKT